MQSQNTANEYGSNPVSEGRSDRTATQKSKTAFRTISEVAQELDVQQHVLRFWETKFSQVRPLKRGGGRRYYRPEDIELLKKIHNLLYTQGYTIKGVQKLFRDLGKNKVLSYEAIPEMPLPAAKEQSQEQSDVATTQNLANDQEQVLRDVLGELKELRKIVSA